MAKLQIFIEKTPVYNNATITLRTGFFADNYSLTDVTSDCIFTINFGNENITQVNNNKFTTNKAGDIGIQALYTLPSQTTQQYIANISFLLLVMQHYLIKMIFIIA
jgi:large exoprotein involved in heme utilization and adhesion